MQKTEVAGTSEAFGQHMLENQPQELNTRPSSSHHLSGLAILVTKRAPSLLTGDNILFLDHAFRDSGPDKSALFDRCRRIYNRRPRFADNDEAVPALPGEWPRAVWRGRLWPVPYD